MHSFIFHSSSSTERLNAISSFLSEKFKVSLPPQLNPSQNLDPNLFPLQKTGSIGIEDIRVLQSNLSRKPLNNQYKCAFIYSAENLTIQAQHALLKTLEEPTPRTIFVLELQNPYSLLPTILSRCQLIEVPSIKSKKPTSNQSFNFLDNIDKLSPGKRLQIAKELEKESDLENYFLIILSHLRTKLPSDPSSLKHLKAAQEAHRALKANVNSKLVLEHWLLSL